ncbi:MAG: glycosyltransferase, partial [Saccharofermentanales bacterium]
MAGKLNIYNKPYVVVEALVDINERINELHYESINNTKRVVYTGGLTASYGILNLLNAFNEIKENDYQLIICGDGETKEEVIKAANTDKRIKYLGVISYEETQKIQRHATVLINPRQNIGEYTKYSFPIKTIEYLLSGAPVICYKLSGIPCDYDDYLIYVEDFSTNGLSDIIVEVCNMSENERAEIGKKNRQFVLEKKNHIIQTKRILDMILQNYKPT